MSFFTRRGGKIFRDPRVTWKYNLLHFSFENVLEKQKSETMLKLLRCEYLEMEMYKYGNPVRKYISIDVTVELVT